MHVAVWACKKPIAHHSYLPCASAAHLLSHILKIITAKTILPLRTGTIKISTLIIQFLISKNYFSDYLMTKTGF